MLTKNIIKQNTYYDSVTLMMISSKIAAMEGVIDATVMMATEYNKKLMSNSGLLLEENLGITPNDMVIAINAESEEVIDKVIQIIKNELENKNIVSSGDELRAKTLDSAVKRLSGANVTIISIPGRYAKREAMKALENGLHVLLFSDNVTVEEENQLKDKALEKGLLMMGPDCGTAIINGVALGFANVVKRGNIGIVAAAGTGLQEVACLVHKFGGGVSQALGTGGRDVKEAVGGKMMLMELEALSKDPDTKVIVIVSKPPHKSVMDKVVSFLEKVDKPVVTCFIGGDKKEIKNVKVVQTFTLEDASKASVSIINGEEFESVVFEASKEEVLDIVRKEAARIAINQKYIKGLYSGGTLSSEAMIIMKEFIGDVYSNIPLNKDYALGDVEISKEHTILDLGDDYFTNGRPHPMIDPRLRVERIRKEGMSPETAVILLDVVLGYGSNTDMAGALIPAIVEVREKAKQEGRYVSFIASVCGTDKDIQQRNEQIEKLEGAGVIVMPSNAQAVRMAVAIATRGKALNNMIGGYDNGENKSAV